MAAGAVDRDATVRARALACFASTSHLLWHDATSHGQHNSIILTAVVPTLCSRYVCGSEGSACEAALQFVPVIPACNSCASKKCITQFNAAMNCSVKGLLGIVVVLTSIMYAFPHGIVWCYPVLNTPHFIAFGCVVYTLSPGARRLLDAVKSVRSKALLVLCDLLSYGHQHHEDMIIDSPGPDMGSAVDKSPQKVPDIVASTKQDVALASFPGICALLDARPDSQLHDEGCQQVRTAAYLLVSCVTS
eukprot:1142912-Pelagomonas_calceolata.AAC.17